MRSFFVPARSSRHRQACLALYRSLLRLGPRIPLPADLAPSPTSPLGPAHPIRTLIRNAFHRNRRDTSPRLVVSALKNGYHYLTLLTQAAAGPSVPEYTSVLTFLRENTTRVISLKEKTAREKEIRVSTAPIPGREPLLKKVSSHPPIYEPAVPPRPLATFKSGIRKPPTLAATNGVPFLRYNKPMPRFLERVVRQRSMRRHERIGLMVELQEDGMEEARLEDEWERLVGERRTPKMTGEEAEPTFRKSLRETLGYLSKVTEEERDDLVARGRAMWKMVLAEQEMALKEERESLLREGGR